MLSINPVVSMVQKKLNSKTVIQKSNQRFEKWEHNRRQKIEARRLEKETQDADDDPELTLRPKINKPRGGQGKLRSPKKFAEDVEKDLARRRQHKRLLEQEVDREITGQPQLFAGPAPKKKGDQAVHARLYHSA